jgi:hypothetical protein
VGTAKVMTMAFVICRKKLGFKRVCWDNFENITWGEHLIMIICIVIIPNQNRTRGIKVIIK